MWIAILLLFLFFASLGFMWFSGFSLAETSNKIGLAVAGVTGVTGTIMSGWSEVLEAINTVLSGNSPGFGMTLFVFGLLFVMAVWILNSLFTANHEPIV